MVGVGDLHSSPRRRIYLRWWKKGASLGGGGVVQGGGAGEGEKIAKGTGEDEWGGVCGVVVAASRDGASDDIWEDASPSEGACCWAAVAVAAAAGGGAESV